MACAIGGQRKERGVGKKERETAALSSGTSGAARGKGREQWVCAGEAEAGRGELGR